MISMCDQIQTANGKRKIKNDGLTFGGCRKRLKPFLEFSLLDSVSEEQGKDQEKQLSSLQIFLGLN